MIHEEFVEKLGKFLTIHSHSQAPHSGYHHIVFTATEHQLRRLLKASHYFHFNISVYLTEKDEIVYIAHIASGEKTYDLIAYLESDLNRIYTELLHMDLDRRKEIIERLS